MANILNAGFLFLTSKYSPLPVALKYPQRTNCIYRLLALNPSALQLDIYSLAHHLCKM